MRVPKAWDLVWHCLDCEALVGCHKGTDIPLGLMADTPTRRARYLAHRSFDKLWKGKGGMNRPAAYAWMATVLGIPAADAHIGMLSVDQCERLASAVAAYKHEQQHAGHWKQKKRKKRR